MPSGNAVGRGVCDSTRIAYLSGNLAPNGAAEECIPPLASRGLRRPRKDRKPDGTAHVEAKLLVQVLCAILRFDVQEGRQPVAEHH